MRFSEIPGHENVKARLRSMVDEDRLPHALMLCGPAGVGLLAMGRALAQYIHCQDPEKSRRQDSCGRCPACLQHRSLNNPDIHYSFPIVKKKSEGLIVSADYAQRWREYLELGVYASWEDWLQVSNVGNSQPAIYVEESAEIVRRMNLSNYSARYKIALIWLPERLQAEAANKLLKIIEEPFADTRFILVSIDPASILPTISSRTQRVELSSLRPAEIASLLERDYGLDRDAARAVAERADGSMGAAIGLASARGERTEFAPMFRDMMRKAYSKDVKGLRLMADDIAAMGREKSRRFLVYCCDMVRENFICNMRVPELLTMDPEEMRFSSRFSPFINSANVERMLESFTEASADIARNAAPKIVMFDTLLQLIVSIMMKPSC